MWNNNQEVNQIFRNYANSCRSLFNICHIMWILVSQLSKYYLIHNDRSLLVKTVAKKVENINIVYVKLFQAISNNSSILTCDEQNFLVSYTDQVRYTDEDVDLNSLNILRLNHEIYVEEKPINSGVVALVYRGFYKGEKIAVKVLKRGIETKILSAIRDYELLFNIMKGLPYLRQLQLHRLLSNNKHLLIEQVDFKKEIENINLFRESNQNLDWIKIPKVHTELSGGIPSIIVMEYIEGIKYKQLNNDSDSDKEMFARLMLRFCMVSMLYNSAVHCDLHAGNLIFIKNDIEDIEDLDDEKPEYVLGIIDFGLSFFPSRENQNIYYNFLKDVLINKELSTTFIDTDLIQPKHIKEKSTYFLKSLIIEELNAELKIHQDDMNPEMMINWNTILNKYNLFFSDEGNKLLLSLFVSSETTKSLSTDWTSIMADEFNKLNAINKLIEI